MKKKRSCDWFDRDAEKYCEKPSIRGSRFCAEHRESWKTCSWWDKKIQMYCSMPRMPKSRFCPQHDKIYHRWRKKKDDRDFMRGAETNMLYY